MWNKAYISVLKISIFIPKTRNFPKSYTTTKNSTARRPYGFNFVFSSWKHETVFNADGKLNFKKKLFTVYAYLECFLKNILFVQIFIETDLFRTHKYVGRWYTTKKMKMMFAIILFCTENVAN